MPDQRPYKFAGFLHPTLVNQILRALAEGNGTPGSGILERSGPDFSIRSDVAPIVVTPSVSPIEKPLTILIPDLRISKGGNEFALDVTVGVALSVDASTRKLKASLTAAPDTETLKCGVSSAGIPEALASYSLCASRDWYGDPGVALPSIPDSINYVAKNVVPPLIEKSLGEVEVPQVEGFDLLSLGSSKVANVEGFPSVYVGYPQPSLEVEVSSPGGALLAHATATGLPGTGAIDYSWTFSDMYSPRVYTPLGSGDAQSDALSLYSPSPSGGFLWLRKFGVNVTVTASRGGETRTATTPYVWYRP